MAFPDTAKPAGIITLLSKSAIPLLLAVLPLLIFHASLREGLSLDIPLFLQQAILYSPLEYFFDPYAYRHISRFNLTPLITLSYHLDYWLAGINPLFSHLHNLLSAGLMLALGYLFLLRIGISRLSALLCMLAFLVMPSFNTAAVALNTRHYTEGMIFSLLSVLAMLQYYASPHKALPWLSALCYLLACSAKEIFAPLPMLLFFATPGGLLPKARSIVPHAIAALLYLCWRIYMLGGTPEVYQKNADMTLHIQAMAVLRYFFTAFSLPLSLYSYAILLLLCMWRLLRSSPRTVLLVIAAFLAVCLPLLSLVDVIAQRDANARWHFLFNWIVLVFIGWGISATPQRWLRAGMQLLLCLIIVTQLQYIAKKIPLRASAMNWLNERNEFILAGYQDRYLLVEETLREMLWTDYMSQVAYLKQLHDGSAPSMVIMDNTLLNWIPGGKQLKAYSETDEGIQPIEAEIAEPMYMQQELEDYLSQRLYFDGSRMSWDYRELSKAQCDNPQIVFMEGRLLLYQFVTRKQETIDNDWYMRHAGITHNSELRLRCKQDGRWHYSRPHRLVDLAPPPT